MKYVAQPPKSSLCGQACVAMVAGVSLEESIEAFSGRRGKTSSKDLVLALRILKVRLKRNKKPHLRRGKPNNNCIAICTVIISIPEMPGIKKKTMKHWVVSCYGTIVDPDQRGYETWSAFVPHTRRITSFLEIA